MNNKHQAYFANFSLSHILGELGFTTKLAAGTCQWMAYKLVELSEKEEESVLQATMASDIWAFGMTILEV